MSELDTRELLLTRECLVSIQMIIRCSKDKTQEAELPCVLAELDRAISNLKEKLKPIQPFLFGQELAEADEAYEKAVAEAERNIALAETAYEPDAHNENCKCPLCSKPIFIDGGTVDIETAKKEIAQDRDGELICDCGNPTFSARIHNGVLQLFCMSCDAEMMTE
jgi:hypothetical protein